MVLVVSLLFSACQARPVTQNLPIIMGEEEIIQEVSGEEELTGEFHRWEPSVLMINKEGTVNLTVTNPRSYAHSFILPEFGVGTSRLKSRGGTDEVSFVADQTGVFQFACDLPYDEE